MSQESELVALLCGLVALPSVNPEGDPTKVGGIYGEERVAAYVEGYFADLDTRFLAT